MATKQQADSLKTVIDKALTYFEKNLLSRPEWGAVNFDGASHDLERLKSTLSYLKILPLEALPDQAVNSITQSINQVTPILDQIDKFNITTGNPAGTRDGIQSQLHTQVDNFYTQASAWVPFLAYQKGDVAENINKLTDALNEARNLIDQAKISVESRKNEIEKIIVATREASASAGAAVFTTDFENESDKHHTSANKWLIATGIGAVLTVVAAIVIWVHAERTNDLSNSQVVQTIAAKLVFLSMFVSASLWCGKQYRALKHLGTLNRHRALSLRTLKAFSAAASDDQTKNAVLLEATRAVFSSGNTGYLDGASSSDDSPMKIVEIVKSISKPSN